MVPAFTLPGARIEPGRFRIEEIFGWLKTVGIMRQTRHRGLEKIGLMFTFSLVAYNWGKM